MTVKPERVVLVLSGGGMKGMAHIGVLRALIERGQRPAEIVGTSSGALVGALIAGGMAYEELVTFACAIRREDIAVPARASLLLHGIGTAGVFRAGPLRAFLQRSLPVTDFARLRLPLRITAVDLDRGRLELFGAAGRTDCTVADAVFASMAVPLYFPPAVIGGRRYADGGMLAVLPLDVAAGIPADLVVAVDVGPVAAAPPPWAPKAPALLAAHDRAMAIQMAEQKARAVSEWRQDPRRPPLVLIEPTIDPYGTFAFDRTAEFIEAGYRAAHGALAARVASTMKE